MKKTLYLLSIVLTLLFTGCSNSPKTIKEFESKIIKTSSYANVEVKERYQGIILTLENKTDDVIEVDWNSSNLNGSNLFLEGQKYIDAGRAVPATVIAPYSKITKNVFSADNVYYSSGKYGGWHQSEQQYPAKLVLKLTKNNKAEFIVVDLDVKVTQIEPTIQK